MIWNPKNNINLKQDTGTKQLDLTSILLCTIGFLLRKNFSTIKKIIGPPIRKYNEPKDKVSKLHSLKYRHPTNEQIVNPTTKRNEGDV